MNELAQNTYTWMTEVHPALPWVVLAAIAWAVNRSIEALGLWRFVDAAAPWYPLARRALHDLPGVVLAAAWPALTLGATDAGSAVLGAVSALCLPVLREFRKSLPKPPEPPGSSTLLFVLLLSGCTTSLESARRDQKLGASRDTGRCIHLDNARTTWGAVAKGAAVVAGGSGISTIPLHDEQGAQAAMAATAAGAATLGAVAVYVAERKGDAWARECASR